MNLEVSKTVRDKYIKYINKIMLICENCGEEHDGLYGSGRFCSSKCAHSFSTKNDNKKDKKNAYCITCGKLLFINKRSSIKTCECITCKQKKQKYIKPFILKKSNNTKKEKIIKKDKDNNIKNINGSYCKIGNYNNCDECYFFKFNYCSKDRSSITYKIKTVIKYFDPLYIINKDTIIQKFEEIKKYVQSLIDNGLSSNEICTIFCGGPKKGNTIFKTLNIQTRTLSESIRNAIYMGKLKLPDCNIFNSTWHITWDNKEVYLRSGYEVDYAEILDLEKIHYEVESLRLKYFDTQRSLFTCAIPDFYLPDINTIVEIKSTYTLNLQNMKDKFNAYEKLGYNTKLILEHKDIDINSIKIENGKYIF